jgi:hypothetical protein
MPSFYDAHDREPVYPYVLKGVLYLLNNQDVAVSFTSTAFSLMAIWLTYVLGAMVWSRGAGLVAAVGLAIDYDAVSLASAGWRDDVFVAAVVLCGVLTLRCWRVGNEPPRPVAVPWLGLKIDAAYAASIALASPLRDTVRFFRLVPDRQRVRVPDRAHDMQAADCRRSRRVVAVLAGPYFELPRVYDRAPSISTQTSIAAEGQQTSPDGTATYFAARSPRDLRDDRHAGGCHGYPFANKWHGLPWWPGVARWGRSRTRRAPAGCGFRRGTPVLFIGYSLYCLHLREDRSELALHEHATRSS